MAQRDNILQELNEVGSGLLTGVSQNVYTVPAGYFDGLAAQVLNRIKATAATNVTEELGYLSPLLSGIPKQAPYFVPAGYFENIEQSLLQPLFEAENYNGPKEELAAISPLLSGLKKQVPYSVPEGYFETLTEKMSVEENKPATKVVPFIRRKWFRYAAAAMITGIIAMASFLYFTRSPENSGKALANFTRDIKKLDETQKDNLIEFIDAGLGPKQDFVAVNTEKHNDVKELLQGVSEDELKSFQEQTEDIEDVLMTN